MRPARAMFDGCATLRRRSNQGCDIHEQRGSADSGEIRGESGGGSLLATLAAFGLLCPVNAGAATNFPLVNLAPYYRYVYGAYPAEIAQYGSTDPSLVPFAYAPNSLIVGGGVEPPPWRNETRPVPGRLVAMLSDGKSGFAFQQYRDICSDNGWIVIPNAPAIGSSATKLRNYSYTAQPWPESPERMQFGASNSCDQSLPPPPLFSATDVFTYGAPVRRKAIDGGQYDASPMVTARNGLAWETFYWAYAVGMVAREGNWAGTSSVAAQWLADRFHVPHPAHDFELATLPAPYVEDAVVEYVNRADFPNQPDGQFFYAVLASDKQLLDSATNWSRTGKSFKSGGYVSVCRFYGGKNGGPNTHFYSADDKECTALKAIPQLSYEGQTFAINMPMPAKNAAQAVPGALRDCPTDSKPLYRIYNNASASNGRFVSNHRYLTERTDVIAAVAQGWVDEGHVMCVPL